MVMITTEEYNNALEVIKKYRIQVTDIIKEIDNIENTFLDKVYIKIIDSDLSERAINALTYNAKHLGLDKNSRIVDLAKLTRKQLIHIRNFGKKSLYEVIDLLESLNIKI
jgi:DNA-directed RNA polymerase alpha subunit